MPVSISRFRRKARARALISMAFGPPRTRAASRCHSVRVGNSLGSWPSTTTSLRPSRRCEARGTRTTATLGEVAITGSSCGVAAGVRSVTPRSIGPSRPAARRRDWSARLRRGRSARPGTGTMRACSGGRAPHAVFLRFYLQPYLTGRGSVGCQREGSNGQPPRSVS
jgi:hypothetical protein